MVKKLVAIVYAIIPAILNIEIIISMLFYYLQPQTIQPCCL